MEYRLPANWKFMQTWSHSSRNVSSIFSGIHIERFLYNNKISIVYASAEFLLFMFSLSQMRCASVWF